MYVLATVHKEIFIEIVASGSIRSNCVPIELKASFCPTRNVITYSLEVGIEQIQYPSHDYTLQTIHDWRSSSMGRVMLSSMKPSLFFMFNNNKALIERRWDIKAKWTKRFGLALHVAISNWAGHSELLLSSTMEYLGMGVWNY
uniref:Uncharacterized protein n=1 Tax=Cucumis melo TaxID=3656 RepID=A0A9I9E559_CUCME